MKFHYSPQRFEELLEKFRLRCAIHLSPAQHRDAVASQFLRTNPRTMRRWISGEIPIPPTVAMLAEVMDRYDITADDVERALRGERTPDLVMLLRRARNQLRAANELTGVMPHCWDVRNNNVDYCPLLKRAFGFRDDEQITREMWLDRVNYDDRERVQQSAMQAMRDGGAYETIYRIRTPAGEREIHSRGHVLFEKKEAIYFVGVTMINA